MKKKRKLIQPGNWEFKVGKREKLPNLERTIQFLTKSTQKQEIIYIEKKKNLDRWKLNLLYIKLALK